MHELCWVAQPPGQLFGVACVCWPFKDCTQVYWVDCTPAPHVVEHCWPVGWQLYCGTGAT